MSDTLKRKTRVIAFVLAALGATGCAAPGRTQAISEFARDVKPLFARRCTRCHGDDEDLQGGLDLRGLCTIFVGGRSGPAVVPGEPDESLLFQMIANGDMPAEGDGLSTRERERVRRWIASGAK